MDEFIAPLMSVAGDAAVSLRGLEYDLVLRDFPRGLWKAFCVLDPLAVACLLVTFLFVYCLVASWLTGDYSYVDRQWSLVPTVYTLIFAFHPSTRSGAPGQERVMIMAGLTTLWSVRLTFNFWRRGGYSGMEDYRWEALRARMHPIVFQLFNLFFISSFQHVLLFLITVPAYVSRRSETPLNNLDYIAAGLFLFFLVLETTADQQQWNFQGRKHTAKREGKPLAGDNARGFLTSGLFRYSRHPNFFAEQCMWLCVYLFSVAATGRYINYSCVGVLLLMALFQGSTSFTEMLTLKRYPLYYEYQKVTSRLVPFFPLGRVPEKRE
ncbi:uncharacterized protein LOC135817051 [Sycon ciliatum]|uniref:uncharacterized protein LOC135817051 n=1 Tax=Sycon ciliatum TaxID=27933 RepID=UPI0020AB2332|eukprot:scpid81365/ scgid25365/ Uncharacterized protein C594.04c